MSTQETGGGLSKWQIAALIGAPIAAACVLGALYYWRSSQSSEEKDPEKGNEVDTTTSTSGVPKNEAPESEENMVCVRKIISQKILVSAHHPLSGLCLGQDTASPLPLLTLLTPRDDELVPLLNDIHSLSSKRVMRISKFIRWKLLS